MLFYKQLNPQATTSLLGQLSSYTESIILQKGPTLPYQLAYDQVYQLCRNEKQQQVLESLFAAMSKALPEVFSGINKEGDKFLQELAELIVRVEKSVEQVSNVCLYLDLNYCKRDGGVPLIGRLNEILISQFFNQSALVQSLGQHLARSHITSSYQEIARTLSSLKQIDLEQEYFVSHFVKHYLPVLTKHYSQEAQKKFTESNSSGKIENYIQYASDKLEQQSKFLARFWPQNKKCSPNKQFIMRELYDILVTNFKEQIYTLHSTKLFNQLTLPILELFRHNPKPIDIQKHADWYNQQIKQVLSQIPLQNNTEFLTKLCTFYNQITSLLSTTYNKFDIHYRSRFAFEEWVNSERLQMPLRLNEYVGEYCSGKIQEYDVLERIGVVFRLMKEKNAFEKGYRRSVIDRILKGYGQYGLQKEERIVGLMEKECSEQFVKHIKPILQSYKLSPQSYKSRTTIEASPLNTVLLDIENWPYQEKNLSITINPELLKLTYKTTQTFNLNSKDKSLYWHPVIGVVTLEMSFIQSKWKGTLIVNTCMANILLHFPKYQYKPYELNSFCLQTGYKLDQIYQSVQKLLSTGILLNIGTQQHYTLSINQSFTHSSPDLDILSLEIGNKFEAKPLQQLKADRKFMVQAIIVKIMKRLKDTDRENILKEAAPMIEKRGFSFNAKFVDAAIDRLIDKEFIRDFQNGRFGYIA